MSPNQNNFSSNPAVFSPECDEILIFSLIYENLKYGALGRKLLKSLL
jgi:hypothetical protein